MGSVTGYFQSEAPLHPAAQAFLVEAFDRGWADPEKRHNESRRAAILLNEAKEIFASHLRIRRDQVEILADPSIGFHLGISGFLRPDSTLYLPTISRSEIFALAEGCQAVKLATDQEGRAYPPEGELGDVLAWQSTNGETGTIATEPTKFRGRVFVDATAAAPMVALPSHWDCALWSARSWQGPAGIAIFALSDKSVWRNPLPHFDQRVSSRDFSIPLTIASAIALEAYANDYREKKAELRALNAEIRNFLLREIGEVDLAGTLDNTLPHLLSFSLLYIDAEMLVSELDRQGFAVDSGSACNSANMEPSHVLAAMGLLTHGNIRMALHNEVDRKSVLAFLQTLKSLVLEMRS